MPYLVLEVVIFCNGTFGWVIQNPDIISEAKIYDFLTLFQTRHQHYVFQTEPVHASLEVAGEIWNWPLLGVKGLNVWNYAPCQIKQYLPPSPLNMEIVLHFRLECWEIYDPLRRNLPGLIYGPLFVRPFSFKTVVPLCAAIGGPPVLLLRIKHAMLVFFSFFVFLFFLGWFSIRSVEFCSTVKELERRNGFGITWRTTCMPRPSSQSRSRFRDSCQSAVWLRLAS